MKIIIKIISNAWCVINQLNSNSFKTKSKTNHIQEKNTYEVKLATK